MTPIHSEGFLENISFMESQLEDYQKIMGSINAQKFAFKKIAKERSDMLSGKNIRQNLESNPGLYNCVSQQIQSQLTEKLKSIDRGSLGHNETANYRKINEMAKYENLNWVLSEWDKKNLGKSISRVGSPDKNPCAPDFGKLEESRVRVSPHRKVKRQRSPLAKVDFKNVKRMGSMYLPISSEGNLGQKKRKN